MKKLDYLRLHAYLFVESILWTLTDLVRASRMRHAKRMHDTYKPPVSKDTDQPEADIKK